MFRSLMYRFLLKLNLLRCKKLNFLELKVKMGFILKFFTLRGYEVKGIKRRMTSINNQRIDHKYQDSQVFERSFYLFYGDLTDSTNLKMIVQEVRTDEIYNLAAMSHLHDSVEEPEYTTNVNGV